MAHSSQFSHPFWVGFLAHCRAGPRMKAGGQGLLTQLLLGGAELTAQLHREIQIHAVRQTVL